MQVALAILFVCMCAPLIMYIIHVVPALVEDQLKLFVFGSGFLVGVAYVTYLIFSKIEGVELAFLPAAFTFITFTAFIEYVFFD